MTELIKAWFELAGAVFSALLAQPEFMAVFVGTLTAISVTQVVKMYVIHSNLPNGPWRQWYLVTTVVGLVATFALWRTVAGFCFGLCVGGMFAPLLYLIGTRTLYKFWPDLQYRISATPRKRS